MLSLHISNIGSAVLYPRCKALAFFEAQENCQKCDKDSYRCNDMPVVAGSSFAALIFSISTAAGGTVRLHFYPLRGTAPHVVDFPNTLFGDYIAVGINQYEVS